MQLLPSEQLTFCTVRISCDLSDGNSSTGTGFFYRCLEKENSHVPVIVTNKHVVQNAKVGRFWLTRLSKEHQPLVGQFDLVEVDNFEQQWLPHPNPDVDLCIFPLAAILKGADSKGINFFRITISRDVMVTSDELSEIGAAEDVLMVGYPNGIWDHVNNMPIVRRGITATHPNLNYQGRPEFLIDAAVFPGSSGSPVFLYSDGSYRTRQGLALGLRAKLLGVVHAVYQHEAEGEIRVIDVPTVSKPISVSNVPNNLGLVIKAEQLRAFDDVLLKIQGGPPPQEANDAGLTAVIDVPMADSGVG